MNATQPKPSTANLSVAFMLAQLLERLERSAVPVGAEQYRSVVTHLRDEFEQVEGAPRFSALLDAHPAAAELYENLHYAHAGLCRSPLEASLNAELRAREAIDRAMRRPTPPGAADGQG